MSSPAPQSSPPPEVNPRKRGLEEEDDDEMGDNGVPSSRQCFVFRLSPTNTFFHSCRTHLPFECIEAVSNARSFASKSLLT